MPRTLMRIISLAVVLALLSVALFTFIVDKAGISPRVLASYVERRGIGHHPLIISVTEKVARQLAALDSRIGPDSLPAFSHIGAQSHAEPIALVNASVVQVRSAEDARQAILRAQPGDVITFQPGTYRYVSKSIRALKPGTAMQRIVVRAETPGTVTIEFDTVEGFVVSAPYWTFENLHIRGICKDHAKCEHAFHIVGDARHFHARNNTITDFNAHIKVNGANGKMPDHGIIDRNTFTNSSARQVAAPVTPIDLVAASHWTIQRNLISDFVKAHGDRISYGAFVKGGGTENVIERNVVLCEVKLKHAPGQRVGLSLGGGGTERQFCRDRRCIVEQEKSSLRANLIAYCSDDGIYVNRAASSKLIHNTLIDTAGITVRFPQSSADVQGNVVDGPIRNLDDALLRAEDNQHTSLFHLYLGMHPERGRYLDASSLNLAWTGKPPRRQVQDAVPDLCQAARPQQPVYGAFDDFAGCF